MKELTNKHIRENYELGDKVWVKWNEGGYLFYEGVGYLKSFDFDHILIECGNKIRMVFTGVENNKKLYEYRKIDKYKYIINKGT